MLHIKLTLERLKQPQRALADAMGIARPTLAALVNHGQWPRSLNEAVLRERASKFLKDCGASAQELATAFEKWAEPCSNTAQPDPLVNGENQSEKDEAMLLRKQGLHPAAKKHFGLFRDPLADEVQDSGDVFVSPDIRYVREAMWQTALHGGFVAVVGESGAGKSTLRRDLIDRFQREGKNVVVVEPYVLGMEDNDGKGKTLKAAAIAEAIIASVAPLEPIKRSSEARFRQVHKVLRDSRRSGNTHVLMLEEAHGLPIPTLKHLKRFFELEDGFKKLMSIVLIGQPELRMKLSESNHEVREVVQRCEVVELQPLDTHLDGYLRFKFDRVGKPLAEVIDAGGLDAIRAKLTMSAPRAQGRTSAPAVSLLYPLAVGNLLSACMNLAADIGAPLVTADVVKEV